KDLRKYFLLVITLLLFTAIPERLNSYPRNLLVEFSTSVTCSVCPCMDSLVYNELLNQFPGTNAIAYHIGESSDPFANFRGKTISGLLNLIGSPCAQVDRSFEYGTYYDSTLSKFLYRFNNSPNTPIGLSITGKSYNASSGEFTVTFNAITSQTLTGLYFYQIMVYENNLIYPQAQGQCGGGQNFVHQLVARKISNDDVFGDTLSTGTWNANQTFSKTFSTTIKSVWIPENCKFLIVLYKLVNPGTLVLSEIQQSFRENVTGTIGIRKENEFIKDYCLSQNYPNPFNPKTNIKFSIPKNTFVELKVFDILGKEIISLCNQSLKKGLYNAEFDATSLPSGTYLYKLKTNEYSETKRMVLIK
ncbi:MAG: Omp28-related outer membrane protein, partial [Ignavibacteriae bacterium]|nr:Omp28-related outer membrane protein [Ignavibacteriota bacterium]